MRGRLIEGYWDCKYCDAKKISGGMRECPNCGKPQDEDTTFYLSGEKRYVSPEVAVTINRNPNWICEHCESLNSDDDLTCRSCGAPRTARSLNYFENKRKKQEEKSRVYETEDVSDDYINETSEVNYLKNKLYNMDILKCFCIGLFSLLAIIGLIYLFIPKTKEINVSEMSWTRSIDIERYQTVEESDWELPVGARLLYSQKEFSHYEPVIDHYEIVTENVTKTRISGYEEYVSGTRDLGNGYFEEITDSRPIYETYTEPETHTEPVYRDEPVYRTKYYYEIDKWLHERSEKTSGYDKKPYWADVELAEDERVSGQSEAYYVEETDEDGKTQQYSMNYDEWNTIKVGQTIKVEVSILGHATLTE